MKAFTVTVCMLLSVIAICSFCALIFESDDLHQDTRKQFVVTFALSVILAMWGWFSLGAE